MLQAAGEIQARYEGAAPRTRSAKPWTPPSSSANAEIGSALTMLRNRSRDLVRNNAMAAALVRRLPPKVIGKGVRPRLIGQPAPVKAEALDGWERFVENCDPEGLVDFHGIQRLAFRTVMESGEALVRLIPGDAQAPLQLRVLEPDFIDLSRSGRVEGGGWAVQGVEYNARGQRIAYWLHDEHPGAAWPIRSARLQSRRVPAEQILPVMEVRRPGQVHGVPWLTPAVCKLKDIEELEEARYWRKRTEALFSVFVRTDPEVTLTGERQEREGKQIENMAPAVVHYLNQGEDVEFASPPASEGDVDWLIMQLQAVAAAVGVPYHLLTGDLRQANYSSLRAGNLDMWALIDDWQEMLIGQLCRRVWASLDSISWSAGLRRQSVPRAGWDVPERPMVDPHKDAAATLLELRMGRKTLPEVLSGRGRDPEEVLAELAAWNGRLDDLGIVLESDPRWSNADYRRPQPELDEAGGVPA